ncbi:MAG: transposase, partial [Candidatus Omnitrophota bacterium]
SNGIKIKLNEIGLIVDEELKNTENIRNEIKLDRYIIMPNHLHCIIIINHNLTGGQPSAPTGNINRKHTLSSFVSGFKSIVTKRVNILLNTPRKPVWQRSFYDHIIRNDRSLNAIREYISNNPVNWQLDIDNLINL